MKRNTPSLAALAAVVLFAGRVAAAAPAKPAPLSAVIDALNRVEAVEMLGAILRGDPIGSGTAWFHPAQSEYDWKWLARRMDADHDGAVTPDEFTGPRELFDRLDRDHDGRLTAEDFDWSDSSPYWRQTATARQLLRRADADGDGKLSAEEWQALFQQAAKGKDKLTTDDLRVLLFPTAPPPCPPPAGGGGEGRGAAVGNAVAADAAARLPEQRDRLRVRGAGGWPARPGFHSADAGRQASFTS